MSRLPRRKKKYLLQWHVSPSGKRAWVELWKAWVAYRERAKWATGAGQLELDPEAA